MVHDLPELLKFLNVLMFLFEFDMNWRWLWTRMPAVDFGRPIVGLKADMIAFEICYVLFKLSYAIPMVARPPSCELLGRSCGTDLPRMLLTGFCGFSFVFDVRPSVPVSAPLVWVRMKSVWIGMFFCMLLLL